jgi:hypothetical protein
MNMNINTDLPAKPPVSDTEMDEFESSQKLTLKGSSKNILKIGKIAAIILALLFIVLVGIYALNMVNQARNAQQPVATPTPSPSPTPSPTPQIEYPLEYKNVESKIEGYTNDLNTSSEERTRLNPPAMNISVKF